MQGATLFSDQTTLADYIDMVLRNAKMLAGIDLVVKGDTPKQKAGALLACLVDHGLAEHLEDEPPEPITVPAAVWRGLEAVRDSGTTNMFDRPAVASMRAPASRFVKSRTRTSSLTGPPTRWPTWPHRRACPVGGLGSGAAPQRFGSGAKGWYGPGP